MILHPNVKVNLGLDVLRKRPDGYHDLNTLFVPYFGISDTLEIISGDDFSRTSAELFSRYDSSSIRQSVSEDGKLMITSLYLDYHCKGMWLRKWISNSLFG